jgi:hypothetical protein
LLSRSFAVTESPLPIDVRLSWNALIASVAVSAIAGCRDMPKTTAEEIRTYTSIRAKRAVVIRAPEAS